MLIERLKLTNFRNFEQAEVEFAPKNNLIYGPNGSGKTNLLEALFYVGCGKSFRTHLDEHLIRSGAEFFRLEAHGRIEPHQLTLEIAVQPGRQKLLKVNSAPVKRLSQLFEYFRLVEFSPDDLLLATGPPSTRRRFLSLTMAQAHPAHIALLTEYRQVLAQRNALLKSFEGKGSLSATEEASLSVWDEKLAGPGTAIIHASQDFIRRIVPLAEDYYHRIADSGEALRLEYHASPRLKEYTAQAFMDKLLSRRRRELALGQSMYGPHRDDLLFFINDLEARDFASQGQTKTAVLSVKLALYEHLSHTLERRPVFLFDEIFSDLDARRLEFVVRLLPELGQIFVTTSKLHEISDLDIFGMKYGLDNGTISLLRGHS